ncbi:hypothetical protein CPT_Premi_022 [Proteus phage Premi]|uniref:Uncharacterized protein n=1 Tax=Proteus phage Premi TaxID=3097470 RepID=A0ABZ1A0A9_9CAUD|nr:hypothetical protein CPT_Premi_022 [Proteus phage Premi]
MFTIETISNRVVKAGKLEVVESFIVVDADGNLVSGTKAYDTREEAQAKIDSMGNFSLGLEFAKAQFPTMSEKALIGKANVVAQYLDWVAAGKPVVSAEAPVAEEAPVDAESTAPVMTSEEEEF